jgi:hypothetical protein
MAVPTPSTAGLPNGSALAAVLAAGIGAFAMGALVIANEAGLFVAPTLYGPAGGLSGRSTLAVIVWLAAWAVLHARWRARDMAATGVVAWTWLLIVLALVATFPPVWELL